MASLSLAFAMGGRRRRGPQGSALALSAAVLLVMGHMSQVAVAQNILLPGGLGQWAGMGVNALGAMPGWGGLSLGGGLGALTGPFQFGQFGGLGLFRDGSETDPSAEGANDPLYGQPFDDTASASASTRSQTGLGPGIAVRNNAQKQQKLRELQAALKGDPAIAAVVAPSLFLASSICFTVAGSLGVASTAVGIAGALAGNLVAWSKWLNNAEIFFLSLRTGGRRSLLESNGTEDASAEEQLYRNHMLLQLRAANDAMSAWGEQAQKVRDSIAHPQFLDFLRSQASALQTARQALGAVQSHPLGHALELGSAPLGLFRGLNPDGTKGDSNGGAGLLGGLGGGAAAERIANAVNTAATAANTAAKAAVNAALNG